MERYFEKNEARGLELTEIHDLTVKSAHVVDANLFFLQEHGDEMDKRRRVHLAASCYSLIAMCEAIVDTYAADGAEEALEMARREIALEDDSDDDALTRALREIFG